MKENCKVIIIFLVISIIPASIAVDQYLAFRNNAAASHANMVAKEIEFYVDCTGKNTHKVP
jgi:hypothetical protein